MSPTITAIGTAIIAGVAIIRLGLEYRTKKNNKPPNKEDTNDKNTKNDASDEEADNI